MNVAKEIQSFDDLEGIRDRTAPVVTAFSGGVDSSYLLLMLKKLNFTKVYAVSVNVGAPMTDDELAEQKQAAEVLGASLVVLDGQEQFIAQAIIPAIKACASYLGGFPVSSSLSRPVIAGMIVGYAKQIGAGLILHTANLSQNSLPRLNNGIKLAGHTGPYGSPYTHSVIPRQDKIDALAEAGLRFLEHRGLSGDKNFWCNEFESGSLDDPSEFTVPEQAYIWTAYDYTPETSRIKLAFENGLPVSIDDKEMPLIDIIKKLNTRVGKFCVGRYEGLEHVLPGQEGEGAVLEVREAPAATMIFDALHHLSSGSLPAATFLALKTNQMRWALEAAEGRWGSDIHKTCGEEISTTMEQVSGNVSFTLGYRRMELCGVAPVNSICVTNRDAWEEKQVAEHIEV